MRIVHGRGTGWHRDLPDIRDCSVQSPKISGILKGSTPLKKAEKKLPPAVDLREWCSPVEDQGQIGSCTANAGVGMLEYFELRTTGKHLDGSRLFLYKVTRELAGFRGDDGAYLRDTMKAMAFFGVPPEKYWPYQEQRFNDDPTPFCFSFAQNYQALEYYRLDPSGTPHAQTLQNLKTSLAAELPAMFGFSVYNSIPPIGTGSGDIPFPGPNESVEGGHAVLAVGYDDKRKIGKTTGALLIRNSWSEEWGEAGYGWLPYEYVLRGLADDFWSMVKAEYVNTDLFS